MGPLIESRRRREEASHDVEGAQQGTVLDRGGLDNGLMVGIDERRRGVDVLKVAISCVRKPKPWSTVLWAFLALTGRRWRVREHVRPNEG